MAYRLVAWLIMPFLRWRIRHVIGLNQVPATGALIIVANHNSWIDPALIISTLYPLLKRPICFIAASGKYRALGGLPIDRSNKAQVVDTAVALLNKGGAIGVFPEGNANSTGDLQHGRTGAARLALRSGAPVLPIGVRYTQGKNPLAVLRDLLRAKHATLEIGAPLRYQKTSAEGITYELLQAVTRDIIKHLAILSGKHNSYGLPNSPPHSPAPDSPPL